jgi:glycosyltransferase involved in cell wall biosynthesis
MKNLVFTVTNDLTYDQRMIRICTSLAAAGYKPLLVGRCLPDSVPLIAAPFLSKRIRCLFKRSKLFYAEYNFRLFFFLLFRKIDCVCAIDLDTILPVLLVSRLRKIPRVYDAHELFCEMKEIVSRPQIYKAWKWIEQHTVPYFNHGYTVNQPIADAFYGMYKVKYEVVRNLALLQPLTLPDKKSKYVLYQGAVNEGRCFETLIPAMQFVDAQLIICGDGNFMQEAKQLATRYALEHKVIFKGKVTPDLLKSYTINAWIGITLFENKGLNNYYSLANRFFDYLQAGIPQVCVDYPVYRDLNNPRPFAVLIDNLEPAAIATAINSLLNDQALYNYLQQNALLAREELNWQQEEKKLISFYRNIHDTIR